MGFLPESTAPNLGLLVARSPSVPLLPIPTRVPFVVLGYWASLVIFGFHIPGRVCGLEACSVQGFRVFRPRGSLCLSVSLSLSLHIYIYMYI